MKAQLEVRYPGSGFAYTKRTRMLFAPKFTVTRKEEDKPSTDLVVCQTNGRWAEPTKADLAEVRAGLIDRYPDRKLFADTTEGLVPIYDPAMSVVAAVAELVSA